MYQPILKHEESTKTVHICAWCDEKGILTKEYRDGGYYTTHGACKLHFEQVIDETIKFYEKNGFSIGNDDIHVDVSSSVQHDPKFPI